MTENKPKSGKYVFVHIVAEQRVLANQIVQIPENEFERLDAMLNSGDMVVRREACSIISNEWIDYSDLADKTDLEVDEFSVIEEERWKQQN